MAGRMNLATLMMLRGGNNRGEGGGGQRRRTEFDGGIEDRRRGHARSEYDEETGMRRRYQTRGGYDGDGMESRRMGFGEQLMDAYDAEMRRRDGAFMHYGNHGGEEEYGGEPIRFGGMVAMEGRNGRGHRKMTREIAEEWVENMEGSDPSKTRGGKWTPEQIKPIAQKYGVPTEGERFWEFYAVMNAMYSDYYAVAKKYNALNPDFFADMAMAFINDKDATENKVVAYYECIAEK